MEPRHVFLVVARLELAVCAVIVGQGLEGRFHRLVALGRRARSVVDRRADAAGGGDDRLFRIDGAGQLHELPGLAQLDHLGNLEERDLGRAGLGRRAAGEDHRVLVEHKVLLSPVAGSAGMTWGKVPSNRFQTVWAVQPVSDFCRVSTASARLSAPAETLSTTSLGTPAAASSSGVAMSESSRAMSLPTRACTRTLEASSAESRFQPTIFPALTRRRGFRRH